MRPLRALLTSLRLVLAILALGLWLGPAAAMSQAMAAGPGHHAAQDAHAGAHAGDHGFGHHEHERGRGAHDAAACCAAACGPAVAPDAGRVATAAIPAEAPVRPGLDAFPPGHDPATAEPPPRTASS